MQGTCRCLHSIGVNRNAVVRRDYYGIDTGAVTGSCNGTEVAHIGYAVEQHQERHLALFVKGRDKSIYTRILHCRNICNDTLVVLACYAVQLLDRHTHNRNRAPFERSEQFTRQLALQVTLHQYLVNLLAGLNSLKNGTYAEYHLVCIYHIILFVIAEARLH